MLLVPFGIFLLKFNEKEDKIDVCPPNVHEFLAQKFYFTLNNFRKVTLWKGMLHLVAPKQVFIWKLIDTFTTWKSGGNKVDNKLSGIVKHEIILTIMWNQNEI